jgi:hypothetical protein
MFFQKARPGRRTDALGIHKSDVVLAHPLRCAKRSIHNCSSARPNSDDPDDKRAQHLSYERKSGTAEGGSRFRDHDLKKGTLKPIIDRVFPFDKIVDAHRYLEASGNWHDRRHDLI